MKTWFKIDLVIQVIGMVVWMCLAATEPFMGMLWYFAMGGIQLVSIVVRLFLTFEAEKDRMASQLTMVAVIAGVSYTLNVVFGHNDYDPKGFAEIIMYALLFGCPMLSIWYLTICYRETYRD